MLAVLAAVVLRAAYVDLLSAHLHGGLLSLSALGLLHRVAGMVVMLLLYLVTVGYILRRWVYTLASVLRCHCSRHERLLQNFDLLYLTRVLDKAGEGGRDKSVFGSSLLLLLHDLCSVESDWYLTLDHPWLALSLKTVHLC